ncbi:MAG: hypothetical protein IKR39_05365 [Lachnospiraceae bacterium]|nr:hypothetical protein [Lachnospiraceae bacterium]
MSGKLGKIKSKSAIEADALEAVLARIAERINNEADRSAFTAFWSAEFCMHDNVYLVIDGTIV